LVAGKGKVQKRKGKRENSAEWLNGPRCAQLAFSGKLSVHGRFEYSRGTARLLAFASQEDIWRGASVWISCKPGRHPMHFPSIGPVFIAYSERRRGRRDSGSSTAETGVQLMVGRGKTIVMARQACDRGKTAVSKPQTSWTTRTRRSPASGGAAVQVNRERFKGKRTA